VPIPEGIDEQTKNHLIAQNEQTRAMFEELKAAKIEKERERLRELEKVSQSMLPTIAAHLGANAAGDVNEWEKILATVVKSNPESARAMYSIISAQASTLSDQSKQVMDVNQANDALKKESSAFKTQLQEAMNRLAALEKKETEKAAQPKPFMTTITPSPNTPSPSSQQTYTNNTLTTTSASGAPLPSTLSGYQRIFAQASLRASDPQNPDTMLSQADIAVLGQQLETLQKRYRMANLDVAKNSDVAGGVAKAAQAMGGAIPDDVFKKWGN
jgi:hypothetical protein